MKIYIPVLTAIIGIAIGWLIKPTAPPAAPTVVEKARPKRELPTPPPAPSPDVSFTDRPSTRPSIPALRNLHAAAGSNLQSRDDAKMMRLTEALNLTKEQQEAILKMIAAAQAAIVLPEGTPPDSAQILTNATTLGGNIEKSLDTILTPEQAVAFQQLRKRAEQNNIEVVAQKQLSAFTDQMDLTSEQREKALERLRDSADSKLSSRPGALSLALDTSILPIGPGAMNSRSVELMQQTSATPGNDTIEAQRIHTENQKQELDRQIELYKDILTPAQQVQLKLVIDERKSTLDRVNELMR